MTIAVEREVLMVFCGTGELQCACWDVHPISPLAGPVTANQQQGWKRETRSRGSEVGQGSKDLLQRCHPQRSAVMLSESSGVGWGKNAKENGGGREKGKGEKGEGKAGRERAEEKALVMFTGKLRPSEIFKFNSSFSGTK